MNGRTCHGLTPEPVIVWDEPHPVYGSVVFLPRTVAHLCPECREPVLTPQEALAAKHAEMRALTDGWTIENGAFVIAKSEHDAYLAAVEEAKALKAMIDMHHREAVS